jgi:serine/threonine-protein kinase
MIVTPDFTVKLTYFALAKTATNARLTHSGVPLGSPWYMSPEQVQGENAIDARSDIYSIGVLLYEIATGSRPFDLASSFDAMRAHLEVAPLAPIERTPEFPPMLNQIILTAMAKDPDGRFQSAEQFDAALESFQKGSRPEAYPALGQPAPPTNTHPLTIAASPSDKSAHAHSPHRPQFRIPGVVQTAAGVAASALLLFGGYVAYTTARRRPPLIISRSQPIQEVSVPVPAIASVRPVSRPIPTEAAPNPRSVTVTSQSDRPVIATSSEVTPTSKKEGNRFVRALRRMMTFHKQENT